MASTNSDRVHIGSVLGRLNKYDWKTSCKRFIKSIIKRQLLEQWDEEQTAEVILYLCVDIAESFSDTNPELEECSLEILTEKLNNRFDCKVSKIEAYGELLSTKQERSSILDFAGKIEATAATLSDVIPELKEPDAREELLISVFLAGLEPTLKRLMAVTEYNSLSDCIRAAKRCERTFEPEKRKTAATVTEQPELPPPPKHWRQSHRPQNYFPNQREDEHQPPGVTCWGCGRNGHIWRNCKQAQGSNSMNPHPWQRNYTREENRPRNIPFRPEQFPSAPNGTEPWRRDLSSYARPNSRSLNTSHRN